LTPFLFFFFHSGECEFRLSNSLTVFTSSFSLPSGEVQQLPFCPSMPSGAIVNPSLRSFFLRVTANFPFRLPFPDVFLTLMRRPSCPRPFFPPPLGPPARVLLSLCWQSFLASALPPFTSNFVSSGLTSFQPPRLLPSAGYRGWRPASFLRETHVFLSFPQFFFATPFLKPLLYPTIMLSPPAIDPSIILFLLPYTKRKGKRFFLCPPLPLSLALFHSLSHYPFALFYTQDILLPIRVTSSFSHTGFLTLLLRSPMILPYLNEKKPPLPIPSSAGLASPSLLLCS